MPAVSTNGSSGLIRVYDPTGHPRIEEGGLADRPAELRGLRPGVLENRKANARLLMETMVEGLRERVDLAIGVVGSKPTAGPASRSTLAELTEGCDFVLVGSSD